jgi:ABC-type antimicrobial peptide transport system permease subunit
MIIGEALTFVGVGILIGLPMCYISSLTLSKLVYGVSTPEFVPVVFSAIILLFLAVAAALFPVYRASKVDPVVALRHE